MPASRSSPTAKPSTTSRSTALTASCSRSEQMKLLVTGGAGFIGSAFVRNLLSSDPNARVTVLDKLTYAGNLDNLASVRDDPRFLFLHGDVGDARLVEPVVAEVDAIVNFAAETHVDRSILDAGSFI